MVVVEGCILIDKISAAGVAAGLIILGCVHVDYMKEDRKIQIFRLTSADRQTESKDRIKALAGRTLVSEHDEDRRRAFCRALT